MLGSHIRVCQHRERGAQQYNRLVFTNTKIDRKDIFTVLHLAKVEKVLWT